MKDSATIVTSVPLTGSGSLSRLVHRGSPSGPGCVGTNDPARWQHLLWFCGEVWAAELLDDCLAHICTFEELHGHFERFRDSGKSPWKPVRITNGQSAGSAAQISTNPKDAKS